MDTKKFLLAVAVAYALLMATTYLIHGVWLIPLYRNYLESWRPVDQQIAKGWILLIARLLYTVMFAWVYTRGAERKLWIGQGIRYGGVVWLFVGVPSLLGTYVLFRVPYQLALMWIGIALMQAVMMGLVVAYFLRPDAPKPPAAEEARKGLA